MKGGGEKKRVDRCLSVRLPGRDLGDFSHCDFTEKVGRSIQ